MSDTGDIPLRVNVALTTKTATALLNLQLRDEFSKVEAVNRAIQLYDFIQNVIDEGGMVLVKEKDGEIQKLVIL